MIHQKDTTTLGMSHNYRRICILPEQIISELSSFHQNRGHSTPRGSKVLHKSSFCSAFPGGGKVFHNGYNQIINVNINKISLLPKMTNNEIQQKHSNPWIFFPPKGPIPRSP